MGGSRVPGGATSADAYSNPTYASGKRGREDDEQDRPNSRDFGGYDAKRRKTQDTFGMPLNAPPHMQAIKTGGQR